MRIGNPIGAIVKTVENTVLEAGRFVARSRPSATSMVKDESVTTQKSFRRVGLARALSKLGYCSRSNAFDLIHAGRVRLNGAIRRDPEAPVRAEKDLIEVDGRPVDAAARVYLMLNKPSGAVTTASDEKGRQTVYAFLGSEYARPEYARDDQTWVAPVGRLDKASEGLLLLTNDSEWAARVVAPETHLEKTYHVQIDRVADTPLLESLARGVKTEDGAKTRKGEFLRVKKVRILRGGERSTWLEIVLDEGKNRHIRRMLEQLRVDVLRLVRVAIGPLLLGQLPKGGVRALTAAEKHAIDRAMRSRVNPD
jgi:23S rRNA pseudouridine2605 synthase